MNIFGSIREMIWAMPVNGKGRCMLQMTLSWALYFLLLTPALLSGQGKDVTRGSQQWVQYYNQTRVSEKWTLLLDGGFRWKDDFSKRSQYIVRGGGSYKLNPNVSLAAGLAHLGTFTDLEITIAEIRPYQELSLRHGDTNPEIRHRFRIEQRFTKATDKNDSQFDRFNWRFRYNIGISIPVVKQFDRHPEMSLWINVADEIFINAGKDIVYNIFDQNRVLIGPEFRVNSSLAFSVTYNGQFAALNLPAEYTYNHIIWLAVKHRLDLRRINE